MAPFVRGGFCPSSLLSEYIRYNRKLNITFHFRFHMYEKSLKVRRHMLFDPSAHLSQTVTPSRTPSSSSVTYCMDGPYCPRAKTSMLFLLIIETIFDLFLEETYFVTFKYSHGEIKSTHANL